MSEVAFKTSVRRLLYNVNDTLIKPDWLNNPGIDGLITEANQWFCIKATPTATTSTVDIINGTQSNAGATLEKNLDGFSAIAGAYAFRVTARLKDGASGTLADNLLIVKVNSVELCRIYITTTGQKTGEVIGYNHTKDARWAMDGTNDLTFVLTAVDADLEIILEAYTTDA